MGKMVPPPLSNETLQHRLLTGASIKGGARGSLTRCAAKLGSLHAKLNSPGAGGRTDQEAVLAIKSELKREIRLFQIEMHKIMIMIQSTEKELQDTTTQEEELAKMVEEKHRETLELRKQAVSVAKSRKCWMEYEALAKLARQRSPRRILQAKMDKANAELEATRKKLYETAAESKIREKQFHLLIQVMTDLRRSLGEPIEIPPQPKEEKDDEDKKPTAKQGQDTEAEGTKAMEIDQDEDNDDGDDGEALYGGL